MVQKRFTFDRQSLYLSEALKSELPVLLIFIFDTNILDKLENKEDKRVDFIFQVLEKLNEYLEKQRQNLFRFFMETIRNLPKLTENITLKVFLQ